MEEQLELNGTEQETTQETPAVDPKMVELQSKYERLSSLEQYVDALGGAEKLSELASLGYQIRNNPDLVAVIQNHLSGKPAAPEPEPVDFYDPEVKALHERVDPKLDALERRNAELEARLIRAETVQYKENVTVNIEKVLEKFKDDDELFREAHDQLTKAMSSASPQQLEQLGSEAGVKTLKMMLIDQQEKLYERRLAQAAKKTTEPTEAPVLSKATDARHSTRAALPANTVSVRSGQKLTPQMTREIMETVTAKMGKDPKSFWN
jgi:hypothetical protein